MYNCINIGCKEQVSAGKFACSQECGYLHYVRKTLSEINALADKKGTRAFEMDAIIARDMIDDYKKGLRISEIALKNRFSNCFVSKFIYHPVVMSNFKLRRRRCKRRDLSLKEKEQVLQLLKEGLSVIEIAARFKSSISVIYRVRDKHNKQYRDLFKYSATYAFMQQCKEVERQLEPSCNDESFKEQPDIKFSAEACDRAKSKWARFKEFLIKFWRDDVKREQEF